MPEHDDAGLGPPPAEAGPPISLERATTAELPPLDLGAPDASTFDALPPPPDQTFAPQEPASPASDGEPGTGLSADGEPSTSQPDHLAPPAPSEASGAPAAETSELPAHLRLPTFDFSLPPMPGLEGAPPPSDTPRQRIDTDELPAHLRLPSFPDFGLPSLPGTEPEASPPAEPAAAVAAPPTDLPPPLAPPPLAPPPLRSRPAAPPPPLAAPPQAAPPKSLAAALGLPELAVDAQAAKPKLALVEEPSEHELAATRSGAGKWILLLVLLGVLGAAAAVPKYATRFDWFGWRFFEALAAGQPIEAIIRPPDVRTPQEKALMALKQGAELYEQGAAGRALEFYGRALKFDPTLAVAHKYIAIALAKQGDKDKAVESYRAYLKADQQAPDRVEVQKIVDDYDKAKAEAAKPPPVPKPAAKKKKRGR